MGKTERLTGVLLLVILSAAVFVPLFIPKSYGPIRNTDERTETDVPTGSDTVSDSDVYSWLDTAEKAALFLIDKANKSVGYSWEEGGFYYFSRETGAAGIGDYFLNLYTTTKNITYLEAAKKVGEWFYSKRSSLSVSGRWPEFDSEYSQNYTGLDKGAAGVGKFLITLYEYTGNTTYRDMAAEVFSYIDSMGTAEGDGIRYPRTEKTVIAGENKTFTEASGVVGSSTSSVSALSGDDNVYYTVSSASVTASASNTFDSTNYRAYALSSAVYPGSDAVMIGQQVRFNTYPVSLAGGVSVRVYRDQLLQQGGLKIAVYEALQNGLPNTSAQVGGFSDVISYSSVPTAASDPSLTFTWSTNTPVLNGSAPYGYVIVIMTDGQVGPDYYFRVVATTDSAYSGGVMSLKSDQWTSLGSQYDAVFSISDGPNNYITYDFSINMTDFGLPYAFDTQYIQNITIRCRAAVSVGVQTAGVYLYDRSYNGYIKFGNITGTETEFTVTITSDYARYLSPFLRTLKVRVLSGDGTNAHNLNIDVLNVTLWYNDEVYSFDIKYGAAGLGMFFLDMYGVTANSTYYDRAVKVGNFLINRAEVYTTSDGLTVAAWKSDDGKYYTGYGYGAAGIGMFLLRLTLTNLTAGKYYNYSLYAANWLLHTAKIKGVYDHLNRFLGAGAYWTETNDTTDTTVYTGYYSGVAGIVDFLLAIYRVSADPTATTDYYLTNATAGGNFLIASYDKYEDPVSVKESTYTYGWYKYAFMEAEPDLTYADGNAGIIGVLDALYLATGNTNFSRCASGGYEYIRTHASAGSSGIYWNLTGAASYRYGLLEGIAGIGRGILGNGFRAYKIINAAEKGADWLYSRRTEVSSTVHKYAYSVSDTTTYSGLAYGTAGVGLSYLNLYRATGNKEYLQRAVYCANALDDQSEWGRSSADNSVQFGIAGGVAGIGLFFLEMARTLKDPSYKNTAEKIASYLISNAASSGSYYYWQNSTSDTTVYYGWDYGTAGIMYFFTEMYKSFHNATYLEYAEGAARWLDSQDSGGLWSDYVGAGGEEFYGFSRGSAGIGYALVDLYTVTRNGTYLTLIDTIANMLMAQMDSQSIERSSIDNTKYSGIEYGQAGFLKFFAAYYEINPSKTTLRTTIDNLVLWMRNYQDSRGAFPLYAGSSSYYNSYIRGTAGIAAALAETYAVYPSSEIPGLISKAVDYLASVQSSSGYWNDGADTNVYLGVYYGTAGIIYTASNLPDMGGPSLSDPLFNISLSAIQYMNGLEINITASDMSSGIDRIILAYTVNGIYGEKDFTYIGSDKYTAQFPAYPYNTNVSFYVVAVDKTGLLNIEDNNGALYNYRSDDRVTPSILSIKTYNPGDVEDLIQYATGGKIVIQVDEPSTASGIKKITITYRDADRPEIGNTFVMSAVAGDEGAYYAVIPGTGLYWNDTLIYNFTIEDNAGNVNITEQYTTYVGDSVTPSIDFEHIVTHQSPEIPAFVPATLKVPAYDDKEHEGASGVAEVFVNYTTDAGLTWHKVTLKYNPQTEMWEGEIPGQNLCTVRYMLGVTDRAGNTAYYNSEGYKSTDPVLIASSYLFRYTVVINWILTLIIIGIIAGVVVLIYYLYARRGDYWERMRREASATAKWITIQEKLTNAYYTVLGFLVNWGDKIREKFRRVPGQPSPIREWFEDKFGEKGEAFLNGLKKTAKGLLKGIVYIIISPALLVAWLVRKTGIMQAFVTVLVALMMIIFPVVKYIQEPPYPEIAVFFINCGFLLFISAFVLLFFHLVYKIAYK